MPDTAAVRLSALAGRCSARLVGLLLVVLAVGCSSARPPLVALFDLPSDLLVLVAVLGLVVVFGVG